MILAHTFLSVNRRAAKEGFAPQRNSLTRQIFRFAPPSECSDEQKAARIFDAGGFPLPFYASAASLMCLPKQFRRTFAPGAGNWSALDTSR